MPFAAGCEPLAELVIEVQLLQPPAGGETVRVESEALAAAASKWLFGEVVSSNEVFMRPYYLTTLLPYHLTTLHLTTLPPYYLTTHYRSSWQPSHRRPSPAAGRVAAVAAAAW